VDRRWEDLEDNKQEGRDRRKGFAYTGAERYPGLLRKSEIPLVMEPTPSNKELVRSRPSAHESRMTVWGPLDVGGYDIRYCSTYFKPCVHLSTEPVLMAAVRIDIIRFSTPEKYYLLSTENCACSENIN